MLLNRDVEKADAGHYLEIIHEQGRRLASLVDEFLDGESVEAGRIELKDEPFDLKPLLVEEAELISGEVSTHRIEVDIGPDSLPVRGDRDRLAQVFVNLLTNAVKYSPDGGLVEVQGEVEGDTVRVHVRDQGIGVPDVHQARIFTKFFRGDARQSGIAGTGLGLAVSREIIEAHGGRIGFTSRPGSGSAFWFELPLAAGALPAREPPPHRGPSTEVKPRGRRHPQEKPTGGPGAGGGGPGGGRPPPRLTGALIRAATDRRRGLRASPLSISRAIARRSMRSALP